MKDVVIEDTHADIVDGVLVQVSQFLADMTGLIKYTSILVYSVYCYCESWPVKS